MGSPDLRQYFNLQFYDIDPQDVFNVGRDHFNRALPELTLREGHIETLLMEAVAEEVAESVYAINRLPDGIFEVLLSMFGIARDVGTLPLVNLQFEVNRSDGCVIPAGTSVSIPKPNDMGVIIFTTSEDLFIEPGTTMGFIPALGNQYTDTANGIPANTPCNLLDTITFVDAVYTLSEVYGGRSPENDQNFLSRGVQRLSRLSSTLVLPTHFSAAALEQVYIHRALALDNYNPTGDPDRDGPAGVDAGHITIAVYGTTGTVSSEDKAELVGFLKAQSLAMLEVHTIDAAIVTQDFSASIHVLPGYDATTVVANVTNAIKTRYSINSSEWNEKIRRNDVIAMISRVEGVSFVENLFQPASDVVTGTVAALVIAGTVTVEVVA